MNGTSKLYHQGLNNHGIVEYPDDSKAEFMDKQSRDVLQCHCSFWLQKGLLVRKVPYIPKKTANIPIVNNNQCDENPRITPDMLVTAELSEKDRTEDATNCSLQFDGNAIKTKTACKFPWTEAIMGCPVKLVSQSAAAWAERVLGNPSDLEHFKTQPNNAWLVKLVDFIRVLVENNDGSYAVTHATMRGPIDMADAMLGTEQLLMAVMDNPTQICKLLEICVRTWIKAAEAQLDAIPPLNGGYVCRYGVWAPGKVIRMQSDASAMISPQLYRDVIWPFDKQVIDTFEYSVMHTHSKYLQHIDNYLQHPKLSAIQVGLDEPPFGPPVVELIPVIKKILKKKPAIIHGVATQEETNLLENELPHEGLMLDLLIR